MKLSPVIVDARALAKDFTLTVQVKKMWLVRIGLFVIRFGCWIGGFSYVDEFPMSLYQEDKTAK